MSARERGGISVSQVLMVVAAVVALYFGVMYLPLLTHRYTMGDIARQASAKMVLEFDDAKIREFVRTEAERQTGVQIGMSELLVQRKQGPLQYVVTIRWTEQVKHLWGKNHVIKMSVTEVNTPGAKLIKNAE